ncbi:MAG: divergent PAP2 family protein [Anaerolineaceae bacterium]|nr:divergent PAP2 family protein [Anaerolineaceae bacterium]
MPFSALFSSPIVIASFFSWLLAQILKVPIAYLRNKQWNWALLIGPGDMPSSHSALMTAVTASIGHYHGFDNPVFVLAFAIAGIVIYDATGVRRQAGLQAQRINLIIKEIISGKPWPEKEFKDLREVIGHSPAEAFGGIVLGLVVSIIVWIIIPVSL